MEWKMMETNHTYRPYALIAQAHVSQHILLHFLAGVSTKKIAKKLLNIHYIYFIILRVDLQLLNYGYIFGC